MAECRVRNISLEKKVRKVQKNSLDNVGFYKNNNFFAHFKILLCFKMFVVFYNSNNAKSCLGGCT